MREVGKKKRKGQPAKRRRYEQIELHLRKQVDGSKSVDPAALPGTQSPDLADLAAGAFQYLDLDDGQVVARDNTHLPGMAKSLGSGRLDPFLVYPIGLSTRAVQLLDYMLDPRVVILRSFRITWYLSLIHI